MKIDGKQIAQKILDDLKKQTEELKKKNITPHLAIILVGDDPASVAYVNQKKIKAEKIGAKTTIYNLESRIQNSELIELIEKLNSDKNIHGIIVQQPLPQQIDTKKITQAVNPKKDVDGFNSASRFEMPITMAVLKILEEIYKTKSEARSTKSETSSKNQNLNDKNVSNLENSNFEIVSSFDIRYSNFISWLKTNNIAIIGKGETGGKPIANTLQKTGIKPIVIDTKTLNPELSTKAADIIISAVGKANVLRPEMIKKGVVLISIGISRGESAKLTGDYDQSEVENIASFYTPTPGGVGPVNVAMLLKNLIIAAGNF
ncbi:MAG: bifunctional 5,10-methylenetetrahydrofolate dehydrogenase/5,10-methenyltetrahydrofolate cyclohydrolase [Candidatus Berkelbacteria bacterium]|nr:bifunctional 5,10-methylenetetrahydrofolate dehydrogenase/5,10-methenyltetrahydrofolate cyclohydrolase [Candidatus Berkelbacteria bacterium]